MVQNTPLRIATSFLSTGSSSISIPSARLGYLPPNQKIKPQYLDQGILRNTFAALDGQIPSLVTPEMVGTSYRIELENNSENVDLIKACLQALDLRFSDSTVEVDVKTFNPARISKLYGTMVRKGDDLPNRPHRLAKLLYAPREGCRPVAVEKLRQLAALVPGVSTASEIGKPHRHFKIERFISDHLLDAKGPLPYGGGQKWILAVCPFNPDHDRGESFIIRRSDGRLGAGCLHKSCELKWADLRERYEPKQKQATPQAPTQAASDNSTWQPASKPTAGFALTRLGDLLNEPEERIPWLLEGMLPARGLSLVAAKPKTGKSTQARCLALAVARGDDLLGRKTQQGPVIYLALEEKRSEVRRHLWEMGFKVLYEMTGNAHLSALIAGYSPKTAKSKAYLLARRAIRQ